MLYMLDTYICSYLIKGSSEELLQNLNKHTNDNICISAITYAELLYGVSRISSKKIEDKIDAIVQKVEVIKFNEEAAVKYANIRNSIEKNGTPIGNMDIMIAACALASGAIIVTNNEKHFKYINSLKIENWTKSCELLK